MHSFRPRAFWRAQDGVVLLLSGDVPLLRTPHSCRAHEEAQGGGSSCNGADGARRTAIRLRPHRALSGKNLAHRRRARCLAGSTENQGNQQRCLCASRRRPSSRRFAGLATANAQGEYYLTDLISTYRRRKLGVEAVTARGFERDSRHQQPVGTGRSEPNRETEKERRAHGSGRHD